jgi:hypothetical protein
MHFEMLNCKCETFEYKIHIPQLFYSINSFVIKFFL